MTNGGGHSKATFAGYLRDRAVSTLAALALGTNVPRRCCRFGESLPARESLPPLFIRNP
jgi:hypothetical protein